MKGDHPCPTPPPGTAPSNVPANCWPRPNTRTPPLRSGRHSPESRRDHVRHDLTEAVIAPAPPPTPPRDDRPVRFPSPARAATDATAPGGWATSPRRTAARCFTGNDARNAPRTVNIVGADSDLDTCVAPPTVARWPKPPPRRQPATSPTPARQRLVPDAELNRQATLYRRGSCAASVRRRGQIRAGARPSSPN